MLAQPKYTAQRCEPIRADIDAEDAGGPPVPSHHSPFFKVAAEPSVRLGTEAMTVAVLDLLKPGASAAAGQ